MLLGFIVGSLVCYWTSHNIVIALLGGIAGYYLFGRFVRNKMSSLSTAQKEDVDKAFFATVFPLMGVIAKADGQVSKSEIAHAEALFNSMGLSQPQREAAIALFKQGVNGETDTAQTVSTFNTVCKGLGNLSQVLMVYLISIAYADNELDAAEEAVLKDIALQLGFSQFVFNQLLGMVKAQHFFEQKNGSSAYGESNSEALSQAYKALGVTPENTDKEIKLAYRQLMSAHHPDKLAGQGVPQHVIDVATAKSQEIQSAYDIVKKFRQGQKS